MTVYVLIYAGQSNMVGANTIGTPAGLPDSSIPMWLNDFFYDDGTHAFGDMRVSTHASVFSHEIATARYLQSNGLSVAIIKLVQGATFSNRWVPLAGVGSPGSKFYPELAEAWAALPAKFPGETVFLPIFIFDQGEEEARYSDLPTVQAWGENHALIVAGVRGVVGRLSLYYVVRTCSTITGETFPGVLEGEQQGAVPNGRWFDTNWATFEADNVHRLGSSQNTLGTNYIGPRLIQDIWDMSISHGTPTRTAIADTVVDRVDAGGGAGKLIVRAGTTVLGTVTLAGTAFGAAANGVATLSGTPKTGTASARGTADNFLCQDFSSVTIFAGSVGTTGSGSDMELATVSITNGDTISITGGSYTAPP
jgi:hypothetical protein